MNLFSFIKSKDFRKTVIRGVLISLLIVGGTWVFLRFYTKHGEKIEVPKVKDLRLSEAIAKLKESGLSYKLIDSTFVKGKGGIIYDQIPSDSSFVKTNREIYLKIYRNIPPQKPVRFKVGEPIEITKTKLLSKGFEIETKYQPGEFHNVILGAYHGDKELSDGTLVNMGEKIRLIVSEKKTTKVDLPNLTGLSLNEAKSKLTEVSLNLDIPLYDSSVLTTSDTLSSTIYKQIPKFSAGKKIRAGSSVNVWLNMQTNSDSIENSDGLPLDNPE